GRTSVCRATAFNCCTCPWVNDRKNVPRVEGARTSANTRPLPACRNRSTSSIESAPATIPASRLITFAAGFAPPLLAAPTIATHPATSSGSPIYSPNATARTSPASAIRFGSSNATSTADAACKDCTWRVLPSNWTTDPLARSILPAQAAPAPATQASTTHRLGGSGLRKGALGLSAENEPFDL